LKAILHEPSSFQALIDSLALGKRLRSLVLVLLVFPSLALRCYFFFFLSSPSWMELINRPSQSFTALSEVLSFEALAGAWSQPSVLIVFLMRKVWSAHSLVDHWT
jgi:hypothetical protein